MKEGEAITEEIEDAAPMELTEGNNAAEVADSDGEADASAV